MGVQWLLSYGRGIGKQHMVIIWTSYGHAIGKQEGLGQICLSTGHPEGMGLSLPYNWPARRVV